MHRSKSERMQRWLVRVGKESVFFFSAKETCAAERGRDEGGGRRHEPAREDGEFMEISLSRKTVMHVSPISMTECLLTTFCSRDNSPAFFMIAYMNISVIKL